jgi:hypothetical protein
MSQLQASKSRPARTYLETGNQCEGVGHLTSGCWVYIGAVSGDWVIEVVDLPVAWDVGSTSIERCRMVRLDREEEIIVQLMKFCASPLYAVIAC